MSTLVMMTLCGCGEDEMATHSSKEFPVKEVILSGNEIPKNALLEEEFLSLMAAVKKQNQYLDSKTILSKSNGVLEDKIVFKDPIVELKSYDRSKHLAIVHVKNPKNNMPIFQQWNLSGNGWRQDYYK